MKKLLALLFCTTLILSCKTTYIYIVRHGEKAATGGDNPHLTDEGKTRSMDLRDMLKDKDIRHVYSTNYFRTIETGTPTASANNLQVELYQNDTMGRFVQKLLDLNENSLVVAHSNSSLTLLDSFHVSHTISVIPEADFDNLFILKVVNGKVKGLKETTYGKASP